MMTPKVLMRTKERTELPFTEMRNSLGRRWNQEFSFTQVNSEVLIRNPTGDMKTELKREVQAVDRNLSVCL